MEVGNGAQLHVEEGWQAFFAVGMARANLERKYRRI